MKDGKIDSYAQIDYIYTMIQKLIQSLYFALKFRCRIKLDSTLSFLIFAGLLKIDDAIDFKYLSSADDNAS